MDNGFFVSHLRIAFILVRAVFTTSLIKGCPALACAVYIGTAYRFIASRTGDYQPTIFREYEVSIYVFGLAAG